MISRKSLIFGVSELIKVLPEEAVPAELYRLMYALEHRPMEEDLAIVMGVSGLKEVLGNFELPLVCPRCENELPQCEVCLFCGHNLSVQEFDRGASNLKPYKPFREGSQRDIIEKCFRQGMAMEDIIKNVKEYHPNTKRKTMMNNIYIYASTWRKEFGWEIVCGDDGLVRLVDTHGNG